ncbi:MAG: RDD family protein [Candidatus Pristimantibacillus sp.]
MNAGFWIRLGALLLDSLIIAIPLTILFTIFTHNWDKAERIMNYFYFLYSLLLPVIWNGFTIGKRICNIQIMKLDGSAPGIGTMLLRSLVGGIVYMITFGIGTIVSAFMIGLREDKRAIHIFIAGTKVM